MSRKKIFSPLFSWLTPCSRQCIHFTQIGFKSPTHFLGSWLQGARWGSRDKLETDEGIFRLLFSHLANEANIVMGEGLSVPFWTGILRKLLKNIHILKHLAKCTNQSFRPLKQLKMWSGWSDCFPLALHSACIYTCNKPPTTPLIQIQITC